MSVLRTSGPKSPRGSGDISRAQGTRRPPRPAVMSSTLVRIANFASGRIGGGHDGSYGRARPSSAGRVRVGHGGRAVEIFADARTGSRARFARSPRRRSCGFTSEARTFQYGVSAPGLSVEPRRGRPARVVTTHRLAREQAGDFLHCRGQREERTQAGRDIGVHAMFALRTKPRAEARGYRRGGNGWADAGGCTGGRTRGRVERESHRTARVGMGRNS